MSFIINLKLNQIKRLIVLVIGGTVFLFGLALLFLPGPGLLILFFGLLILATEFIWAKKLINKIKSYNPLKRK